MLNCVEVSPLWCYMTNVKRQNLIIVILHTFNIQYCEDEDQKVNIVLQSEFVST